MAKSLQARFILPVAAFVILVVLGGAAAFSTMESHRVTEDVRTEASHLVDATLDTLALTHALVGEQTHGAMRLLLERGHAIGPASLGPIVKVKERSVPDLLLGGKPQANLFDLVDDGGLVAGGLAALRDGAACSRDAPGARCA